MKLQMFFLFHTVDEPCGTPDTTYDTMILHNSVSYIVSPEVVGKTVECVFDDIISIGNATVNVTTG